MTSMINAMAVAGLVSVPGMMTGQLLAGNSPNEAVIYQLVVLFLLGCVTFFASQSILREGSAGSWILTARSDRSVQETR